MPAEPGRAAVRIGDELHLDIESLGEGADGMGRVDGAPVFVRGALPGERIRARIIALHEAHARAELLEVEVASENRATPRCSHFGACGGCRMQHLTDTYRVAFESDRLAASLRRHLGDDAPSIEPIVPMAASYGQRCRVVLRFARRRGHLVAGMNDLSGRELLPVTSCPAAAAVVFDVARAIADEAIRRDLAALRAVVTHASSDGKHVHATLVAETARLPHAQRLADVARALGATAMTLNQHEGRGNRLFGRRTVALLGLPFVIERVGDLRLRISTTTTFEASHEGARGISDAVRRAAAVEEGQRAIDLFSGTGRFALAMARDGAQVVGVDIDHQAMHDADGSASDLGLENARFVSDRVEKQILLLERHRPNIVVLDPPPSGCDEATAAGIARVLTPGRIVLVGRDTGTFGREIGRFRGLGYRASRIEAIDVDPFARGVVAVATLGRETAATGGC